MQSVEAVSSGKQGTPFAAFHPQYRQLLIEPTGPSGDVITSVSVETSFPAEDVISIDIVFDASGKHELPVDHAQD